MGKGVGKEPWVKGGFGNHSRAVARLGKGLGGLYARGVIE